MNRATIHDRSFVLAAMLLTTTPGADERFSEYLNQQGNIEAYLPLSAK